VLLRGQKGYYAGPGKWTGHVEIAAAFASSSDAIFFRLHQSLDADEVVYDLSDDTGNHNWDMVFHLPTP